MGAIQHLLERMGYVKLDRYGLLLTPEGRILSSRPAILDDGLGGRIVGWDEGDLAAMELERWVPAQPPRKPTRLAPKRATARAVAVATAPTLPPPPRPPVPLAAKGVAPAAPVAAAPEPARPAHVAVPVVFALTGTPAVEAAGEEPQDDDEWEWTIAVARARAAADEAERAAAAPKFMPVVRTAPIAVVAQKRQAVTTPPPLPAVEEDTQVKAPIVPPAPVKAVIPPIKAVTPPVQVIPPVLPKTIIPVPQLPRVTDPSLVRPAVTARGSGPQVTPALRRVPRGTDRIEDTVRTAAAPANDDKTSPGVALPPSGGGRRVAAKQR